MLSRKFLLLSGLFAIGILTSNCGGGGGGSSSTETTTSSTSDETASTGSNTSNETTQNTRSGQFVDAPVQNLQYKTSSGLSGYTDSNGNFTYKPGDSITFYIGNVTLGTVKADALLTPADLVNSSVENDPKVIALSKFLIALDSDNNTINGINISNTTIQDLAKLPRKISAQEIIQALNNNDLTALPIPSKIKENLKEIPSDIVENHLKHSITAAIAGVYSGHFEITENPQGYCNGGDVSITITSNGEVKGEAITSDGTKYVLNGKTIYKKLLANGTAEGIDGIAIWEAYSNGEEIKGTYSFRTYDNAYYCKGKFEAKKLIASAPPVSSTTFTILTNEGEELQAKTITSKNGIEIAYNGRNYYLEPIKNTNGYFWSVKNFANFKVGIFKDFITGFDKTNSIAFVGLKEIDNIDNLKTDITYNVIGLSYDTTTEKLKGYSCTMNFGGNNTVQLTCNDGSNKITVNAKYEVDRQNNRLNIVDTDGNNLGYLVLKSGQPDMLAFNYNNGELQILGLAIPQISLNVDKRSSFSIYYSNLEDTVGTAYIYYDENAKSWIDWWQDAVFSISQKLKGEEGTDSINGEVNNHNNTNTHEETNNELAHEEDMHNTDEFTKVESGKWTLVLNKLCVYNATISDISFKNTPGMACAYDNNTKSFENFIINPKEGFYIGLLFEAQNNAPSLEGVYLGGW